MRTRNLCLLAAVPWLVLACAAPPAAPAPPTPADLVKAANELDQAFVEAFNLESIRGARTVYATTEMRAKLARYHDDVDHVFFGWNDIWLHPDFASWSIERELAGIRAPIVAILGEDDEYSTPAQIAAIEANAVNAASFHFLRLADCRHSPHRDQPDAVLDALVRFVDRLS